MADHAHNQQLNLCLLAPSFCPIGVWYSHALSASSPPVRKALLYRFESYELDVAKRELRRGGHLVALAPQVFDLLLFFIENRERVVSKDDLIAGVWNGRIVSDSALTTRTNAVRSALEDSGSQQRLIRTFPRKGLRFMGAVQVSQEDGANQSAERAPTATEGPALSLPDKPSVAVLPFTNMSGDREQDYFSDGMAEEIITALSRCSGLFVIARNSSFTYKGRPVDVRQVGQDLDVRYVLEGSFRRAGDRLRFAGQLVDAASGAHIWADRFEGDASDIFNLQDRITENVVAAMEPNLQLAEIERIRHKPGTDLHASDLLLRAQALEYEYTKESLAAALGCLKRAIGIAPMYAPAIAFSAYCYAERRQQGWAEQVEAETADGLRLAMRALDFGRDDANVLWMAAFALRVLGADPHRARELVTRSLQLNPNSAMALTQAGWAEIFLGNSSKALELLGRAERLSPRDPRAWYMAAVAALAHFVAGEFAKAAICAERALAQNARFAPTLRVLAASRARLGESNAATIAVRELLNLEPQLTLKKLRMRLRHMPENTLKTFLEALHEAGVPD
jgi:TolB-like protein